MIQVNRIYLIFNRLVTKKFLVDTSDFAYNMIPLFMFFHSEYSLIAPSANLAEEILYAKVQCPDDCQAPLC